MSGGSSISPAVWWGHSLWAWPIPGRYSSPRSPIHENDTLFNGFSYREVMDVVIANYGHNITEKQFDKALKEFMDIRIENMKENLMMCKANMLKEIRKV